MFNLNLVLLALLASLCFCFIAINIYIQPASCPFHMGLSENEAIFSHLNGYVMGQSVNPNHFPRDA